MREMTDDDLARVRAAVQLRERCVRAALAHHERVELTPRHEYARATFDAVEQIIRADERAKVAEDIASYRGPDHDASVRVPLLSLIEDLTDDGDCHYDHHGYCQGHSLHEKPCPHERAKRVLARYRAHTTGGDHG